MITKEKILEILHSHSYNVEDQAGNHLIVVDDDSWDAVATEVKNCSIPNAVRQSQQIVCVFCGEPTNRSNKNIKLCHPCQKKV